MNWYRRQFVAGVPAFAATIAYPWSEASACGGAVMGDEKYISLRDLKNLVPSGDHIDYLAKHYAGAPIVRLQAPQFRIFTTEVPENPAVVPFWVYLPRDLPIMSVNGLRYDPAHLICTQLEVLSESEHLAKYDFENHHQISPRGTFQVCGFTFPGTELTEINFRYQRWERSRLIAVATMSSTQNDQPPLVLVTDSGKLKWSGCWGPTFVP